MIRHFHFHGWPEVGIPAEGKGMIDIIASVQRQQQQSGNHPIVVHCRYLGTFEPFGVTYLCIYSSVLHLMAVCILVFACLLCAAALVQGELVRSSR